MKKYDALKVVKELGATHIACLLAFFSFVVYVLVINQEMFYTASEHSECLHEVPASKIWARPFGVMQFVGSLLTTLFYYPAVGSTVLAFLFLLIYLLGIKAFRLKGNASALMILPVACLLTSVVDLGYWIYVMNIKGYWFSQTVGYLLMLLMLVFALFTPRKWHLVWYLVGVCLFPALGWFAILFVLCLICCGKPSWREIAGAIMLVFTASIWKALLYPTLNLETVMTAGFPRFVSASDNTPYLSAPFWVLGAFTLLIPVASRYLNKWYVPVLSAAAGIGFILSLQYSDDNYIREMRMTHYAENDQWKEVLDEAEEASSMTVTMSMLKNVAMMHEGGLLDRSFKMGAFVTPINNPDSVHASLLEIASPVVYYNYGLLNEGFRLSFECAVQSGFSPFFLKSLARCAHANGEPKLEKRYLTLLKGNPFYKHWKPAEVSEKVLDLHNCYPDEITGVEGVESYLVNTVCEWYKTDSKLASEQALYYAMLRRHSHNFWAALRKWVKLHDGESFPVHAQEAYIMYMDKAPEEKRMMIPVSEEIYGRYQLFWKDLGDYIRNGKSREETAIEMHKSYGDTYWYYNVFNNRVY